MKKLFVILCAAFAVCAGFAADANQMYYVQIVQPSSNDVAGSAMDVAAYKGNATFVISYGPGAAAYTNTVTIQHATAVDGTYATLTNINGTVANIVTVVGTNEYQTATYPIDTGRLHKYVKATVSKNAESLAITSVLFVAPFKAQ